MCRRLLSIFLSIVVALNSLCQSFDEKDFIRYTKLDGLTQNFITGIVQDSSGYIWIGTNKGLNRFDGKSFTNFFKNTENSPIPENLILSLRLQDQNEIIGTTVAGAFSYNTSSRKHTYFIVPSDSVIFFWANQSLQILKDKNGNYIVSTKTGLYIFNPAGKIICRYDHYKPDDAGKIEIWFGNWMSNLSNGTIFQENNLSGLLYHPATNKIDTLYGRTRTKLKEFFQGKVGDYRISFPGSKDELFIPDNEAGSMVVYNLVTGNHSLYNISSSILSDFDWYSKLFYINDSIVAITAKVGGFYLFHYSARDKKMYCDGQKHFASKYCASIFSDREGRLWVGTNDGLYKQNIRNSFFTVEDISQQFPGILNTGIQSVFIEKEKILIGLGNEGGILLLNNITKKIERHISFEKFGPGSNTINFIFSYHADTLWIGTGKGIIWLNMNNYSSGRLNIPGQPDWMNQTKTRTYLQDTKGDIWLSFGELNSVIKFDCRTHTFSDLSKDPLLRITFCFSMCEDKNKNVWLAGDGISRWNRKKNKIDTLIRYPSASKSLFNYMLLLDCDQNNNLWISSFDNEVLRYDCNRDNMYLSLPQNTMIDGYTVTSSPIINEHIWMGMVNGISAFNIKDNSIKQFNYSDGLPSAVVTSYRKGSFYAANKNLFYFGAGHYLISFTPEINLSHRFLPRFSIEVTGVNKNLAEEIRIPYSQNDVELRFNAINFTDPEENRFAYRLLNGKDSSWRELNTENVVILSKLSPGNHRIQVKLYSVNNRWPTQLNALNIFITPPFWKTIWFYLLAVLIIAAAFYYLYSRRIKYITQKVNIDKQLAQSEMKALHAQMNPHFIFNCLNSIREMILINENDQASRYLSKFARLIRITLNQSSKTFVSLEDTIDYLHRYLEMEQIRKNNFSYSIDVDGELHPGEILLPPMLIQPFIENAIWHGASLKKDMQIDIGFQKKGDELICIIEDNGIGINESLKKKETLPGEQSVGIINIRQRIALLNEKYNLSSTIKIEDKADLSPVTETGTIVTLHLSIKNNKTQWND